jgi:hypothetical protein
MNMQAMAPERAALAVVADRPPVTVTPSRQFDLSPQTFDQALTFSNYLAESDMVPKQYRGKPGDCLIAMQWGMEIGLKPLQALQSIAAINGKPNLYGDAGKALLLSYGCIIEEDDISIVERNGRARCKITRPGRPPVERTFSLENAKTAGIWNKEGPWRMYPWRQMAWRAFWFAARDAAADLLRGMGGFEEAIDYAAQPAAAPAAAPAVVSAADTALQPWPDDKLNEREAKCREWAKAGKAAVDAIAFYSTKGVLSDAQQERIRGWMAPAPTATEAAQSSAADASDDLPWKD